MLGITCALYDEAYEIIRRLKPVKKNGVAHYTGRLVGLDVSLFLTRPGIKNNKKKLLEWLGMYPFSAILNSGFCGSLTNRYVTGDVCKISEVHSASTAGCIQLESGNSAHKILTVDHPVISMDERETVGLKFSLDLVDMESYPLAEIIRDNYPEIPLTIIRIVGDVPGEDYLMKSEIKMRSYFSTFNRMKKLKIILKTGLPFWQIYKRKRTLQRILLHTVEKEISPGKR